MNFSPCCSRASASNFDDLEFADLIGDRLARSGGEGGRFLPGRLRIHRHFFFEIFRRLLEREFAERELHVHFHPQRPQAHEVVNDLARVRAVVEKASLQHHFLGVEADAFVRAGIVIMPPDRILVFPGETKLEIMPGDSFVHDDRPRILRGGAP